jgi:hypothetical protein
MWNRLNREKQMTSDACRPVRPGAVAQRSSAQTGHVSVLPSSPRGCGFSLSGDALARLEPCEGKLSRTVLRGARAGDRSRLPGEATAGRPVIPCILLSFAPERTSLEQIGRFRLPFLVR